MKLKPLSLVLLAWGGVALTLSPAFADLTPDVRREILIREHSREVADGYLLEKAASDDVAVRLRALKALASVQTPLAGDLLAASLSHENSEVRRAAAFALGELATPEAAGVLAGAYASESDPGVRVEILTGIGRGGTEEQVSLLTGVLSATDGDPLLPPAAAEALGMLALRGFAIDTAGQALGEALRSTDPELAWRAGFAVQRGKVTGAATNLRRAFTAPDPRVRLYACRAAAAIAQQGLAEKVVPLMKDADWRVRCEAVRALAACQGKYWVSQAGLLVDDPNENVRFSAIEALGSMGSQGLGRLGDIEKSGDWRTRIAYLKARTAASGEGALISLRDAARDPDWRVRKAAAEAFSLVPTESALLLVEPMVNDENSQVQLAAINSLVEFPQVEALEYIRKGLSSSDIAVLTAAANGVGQRLDRAAVPPLIKAYGTLLSPVDTEPMVAILDAMGAVLLAKTEDGGLGDYPEADFDRAVALMEQATEDAEINVAQAGARNLAVVTGEPLQEIVQPTALPPGFDVDLVLSLETAATHPTARIRTNRGDIVVEFANDLAPATVANFITLARDGFYNGLMFHRVVADFVIQTGDPRGDGWGGPGYAIRCEYSTTPYATGAMGMAHAGRDTGGSQFFFTHSPQPHLDGRYTLFGNIIEGQDVVDRIQVGDTIQEVVLEGL